jgi:hypothetical protein
MAYRIFIVWILFMFFALIIQSSLSYSKIGSALTLT